MSNKCQVLRGRVPSICRIFSTGAINSSCLLSTACSVATRETTVTLCVPVIIQINRGMLGFYELDVLLLRGEKVLKE